MVSALLKKRLKIEAGYKRFLKPLPWFYSKSLHGKVQAFNYDSRAILIWHEKIFDQSLIFFKLLSIADFPTRRGVDRPPPEVQQLHGSQRRRCRSGHSCHCRRRRPHQPRQRRRHESLHPCHPDRRMVKNFVPRHVHALQRALLVLLHQMEQVIVDNNALKCQF